MEQGRKTSVVVGEAFTLIREGLVALCERSGRLRVAAQCGDGREAVALIQSLNPDLALLDFDLPKLFSLEVVRQVRLLGVSTRVLILSHRTDCKTVLEVLRSGAGGYLLTSDPVDHLLTAFRQVLTGGVYVTPLIQLDKIFSGRNGENHKDPVETLSQREFQVYSLLVEGLRAKEIAARLELSPKTIDTYRANLMRKLDLHDLPSLVKLALRRNQTGSAGPT
jgi:DNA-binding NarL/FixJ family response regulator